MIEKIFKKGVDISRRRVYSTRELRNSSSYNANSKKERTKTMSKEVATAKLTLT